MNHLAITISDLHMGRGNAQDDFTADDEFRLFCDGIARYVQDAHVPLTLVLNGDILELWEVVPDEQLRPDSGTAIADGLGYPADTEPEQQQALALGKWQIEQILDRHRGFVAGIRRLTELPGVRILYTFGNHDHALVAHPLQVHVRDTLSALGAHIDGARTMVFGHWFRVPETRSYFEHGNQFAEDDSFFADVDDPWAEAPGFYFLRFVWNRLQAQYAYRDDLSTIIRLALLILFNPGAEVLRRAVHYLYEYFEAHRLGLVPALVRGPAGVIPKLYERWEESGAPLESSLLADAALQHEVERTTLAPEPELPPTEAMRLALANVGGDDPGLPGRPIHLDIQSGADRFWKGLRGRFDTKLDPFPKIGPETVTAFLGHTHRERYMYLRNAPGREASRYINTGCWAHGHSRLAFGWANDEENVFRSRGLKLFR
jgi:UDP-2,3-diacylglucosamine pyrophosphatase LpxH